MRKLINNLINDKILLKSYLDSNSYMSESHLLMSMRLRYYTYLKLRNDYIISREFIIHFNYEITCKV